MNFSTSVHEVRITLWTTLSHLAYRQAVELGTCWLLTLPVPRTHMLLLTARCDMGRRLILGATS